MRACENEYLAVCILTLFSLEFRACKWLETIAKTVDPSFLKSWARKGVWVRFPPSAVSFVFLLAQKSLASFLGIEPSRADARHQQWGDSSARRADSHPRQYRSYFCWRKNHMPSGGNRTPAERSEADNTAILRCAAAVPTLGNIVRIFAGAKITSLLFRESNPAEQMRGIHNGAIHRRGALIPTLGIYTLRLALTGTVPSVPVFQATFLEKLRLVICAT
jgi:hypothetical protein